MTESRSATLTAWIEGFSKMASQDTLVDSFVDQIDEVITGQIPEIAGDAILVQDLHRSTRAQWRAFVDNLREDHRLVLPKQAADLARSVAGRGLDLSVLLKIYRVAQRSVYQFLTEVTSGVSEEGPAREEILVFIWDRAGSWMDDSVESLIETYYEERQRINDGAAVRRAETIEALLGSQPPSNDEATRLLGHPLSQWQTAYVVWAPEAGSSTTEAMVDVATTIGQAIGSARPLTIAAGSRDLWCWAATATEPDLARFDDVEKALQQAGMHAAIGLPQTGVNGFRTSHTEAREAQSLVLGAPTVSPLVRFTDVELLCLIAEQRPLMERMVARELGELAGADKNLGLVRETVLTYLTTLNFEATAERLFVHKNTVRYRIARAEELVGHPLLERSTQVELALRWVALFGPPADAD